MSEPKICYERCCSYEREQCDLDPRDCALAKARRVRKANIESKKTGESVEDILARYDAEDEEAIINDMGDFAEFLENYDEEYPEKEQS